MATVTAMTAARMLAIEAESITGARVDAATFHLILTRHDGTEIDAGDIQGPVGPMNPNAADLSDVNLQTFVGEVHAGALGAVGTVGVGGIVGLGVGNGDQANHLPPGMSIGFDGVEFNVWDNVGGKGFRFYDKVAGVSRWSVDGAGNATFSGNVSVFNKIQGTQAANILEIEPGANSYIRLLNGAGLMAVSITAGEGSSIAGYKPAGMTYLMSLYSSVDASVLAFRVDGAGNMQAIGNITTNFTLKSSIASMELAVTGGTHTAASFVVLRPHGAGDSSNQFVVFDSGEIRGYDVNGNVRNTFDDGSGNMTAAGSLRGNSVGVGMAASGAAGRIDLAAGLVSKGYICPGNATASGFNLWSGTGAPAVGIGNNGDFYFRGDTPGTANQRVYVKSAGAWVGII